MLAITLGIGLTLIILTKAVLTSRHRNGLGAMSHHWVAIDSAA
jgi:hypothetical protein